MIHYSDAMQWVCLVCHKKDWSRSKRLHCVGYFFFSFEKNPTAFQRIILSYWLWLLIILLSFHECLFRHHLQHNQANSENKFIISNNSTVDQLKENFREIAKTKDQILCEELRMVTMKTRDEVGTSSGLHKLSNYFNSFICQDSGTI